MKPYRRSARQKRIDRIAIAYAERAVLLVFTAGVIVRLGNMELDGLPTIGGIVLGLLFGFTSLLYNRARAFPEGPIQRRSLVAAEHAFRATLSYTAGAVLCATSFYLLYEIGWRPMDPPPRLVQAVPMIAALGPIMFFAYGIMQFVIATERLMKHPETLSTREVVRQVKGGRTRRA